ncbi:hypothetical protein F5883DRAFT_532026 [Diaporthe sp. PMI_573]|nr:hypothetical protein F5883DRAFT_532026 [Diaporthaceae sp. PMI_573]
MAQVPAGDVQVPLSYGCTWNASPLLLLLLLLLLVAELPVWWWFYVFSRCPRRTSQLIALDLYTCVLCFHLRIKRPSKDALWVTEQRRSCQASERQRLSYNIFHHRRH